MSKSSSAKADKPKESELVITETDTPNKPRIMTKDGKRVCLHWAIEDVKAKAKVKWSIAYSAIQCFRDRELIESKQMENIEPALKALATPEGRAAIPELLKKLKAEQK